MRYSFTKNNPWGMTTTFPWSCDKTLLVSLVTEILNKRFSICGDMCVTKCAFVPTGLPALSVRSHHDLSPSRKAGCFWWSSGLNLGPSILSICHLTPSDLNTHYRRCLCVCAHVYPGRRVINSRNVHRTLCHATKTKISPKCEDMLALFLTCWIILIASLRRTVVI